MRREQYPTGAAEVMRTESPRARDSAPAADEKVREFAFDDHDFDRICKLIYKHAGISLSRQKRDMVYSRVARRVRALGLNNFDSYLSHLDNSGPDEWQAFTNSLTTNLTSFFREGHHFPILAEHVSHLKHRPIKIWCTAASTGEEPYSLAITMAEAIGTKPSQVRILASDIDTNVLEHAKRGDYTMERVEKMERARLERFFLCGSGANEGHVKVRQELRDMVTFQRINLLDADWKINGPFDVIFCRNVMIYFDKPTQARILERFAPLLRPDGLLFAGHSESLFHVNHLFQLRGKTVYGLSPRYLAPTAK
jgi:chemotaxis protein methyltransferase CheR